jgi:hypothetical protein
VSAALGKIEEGGEVNIGYNLVGKSQNRISSPSSLEPSSPKMTAKVHKSKCQQVPNLSKIAPTLYHSMLPFHPTANFTTENLLVPTAVSCITPP